MRKIFFRRIDAIEKAQKTRKPIYESKISFLGSKVNTMGQVEVQQIQCHPQLADVTASVSGNSLSVWSLQNPEARTEEFSIVNQITSIGWQHSEDRLIATADGNDLVCLFDVRQSQMASKFNLSVKTDLVTWNPCDKYVFATSHEREVKIWDIRKVNEGVSLQTLTLNNTGSVNKMQFDPIFGKLFMIHDKNMIRLFSVEHGNELDHYKQTNNKQLITAQFLPLTQASTPGIIALSQRSHNFLYFQVEEGQGRPALPQPIKKSRIGRVKNSLSDYSASDTYFSESEKPNSSKADGMSQKSGQLQLRMTERKSEFAAPKLQMTSPDGIHDYDAFDIHVNVTNEHYPETEQFQSIAVNSYGEIHLMTLNQSFIESFYLNKPIEGLGSEWASEKDDKDSNGSAGGKESQMKQINEKRMKLMTPAQQKQKELQIFKKLPCIASVELTPHKKTKVAEDEEGTEPGTVGESFSVKLMIKVERKTLGLAIEVPEYYPHAPIQVSLEEQIGPGQLFDQVNTSLQAKVVQKGSSKYASMVSIVQLVYTMLGGKEHMTALDEYDFDLDLDNSNDTEESKSQLSPCKAKKPFDKQKSPGATSGTKQEQNRGHILDGFVVYPKTCGFSWNCYGQLAFFSSGCQYDWTVLDKERSSKKLSQVYDKNEKEQTWTQQQEKLKSTYTQDSGNFLENNEQADQNPQGKKLIEMHITKEDKSVIDKWEGRDRHEDNKSSSYDNSINDSYSSQESSSSEESSSGGSDRASNGKTDTESSLESEDQEVDPSVQNSTLFADETNRADTVGQTQSVILNIRVADFNDDDDNVLDIHPNVLKLFVHSFAHKIRSNPSISHKQPLFEHDVRGFCERTSQKMISDSETSNDVYKLELANYWKMIGVALGDLNESKMKIWGVHPLGKGVLMRALKYFEGVRDVQQIGMVASLLFDKERQIYQTQKKRLYSKRLSEQIRQKREQEFLSAIVTVEDFRDKEALFEKDKNYIDRSLQIQRRTSSSSVKKQRPLTKNSSHWDIKKPIVTDLTSAVVAPDITYNATYMPNSLQENSMEQLSSPRTQPAYGGMSLSNRNSAKNSPKGNASDGSSEFRMEKSLYDNNSEYCIVCEEECNQQKKRSNNLRKTEPRIDCYCKPIPRLGKKGQSAHQLYGGKNKTQKSQTPAQKRGRTVQMKNSDFSSPVAIKEQPAYFMNSPGSPTVGATSRGSIINKAGDRVAYTGSTKKSMASSFKSKDRREVYSMYDCRSSASESQLQTIQVVSQLRAGLRQTKCLLDKLEFEKKKAQRVESTNADSQSSLFSSSDDQDKNEEEDDDDASTNATTIYEPSTLSLILKDDPETSFTLLVYLKHYSELLFNWGERNLAVQACKLINDACSILQEYHQQPITANNQLMLGTFNNHHFDFKVIKREWLLSDFILFSEASLNYLVPIELKQPEPAKPQILSHTPRPRGPQNSRRSMMINTSNYLQQHLPQGPPQSQEELLEKLEKKLDKNDEKQQKAVLVKCAICDMQPRGLTFRCNKCFHGGHYQHLAQWASMYRKRGVPIDQIPCPTGCGCTQCFILFDGEPVHKPQNKQESSQFHNV